MENRLLRIMYGSTDNERAIREVEFLRSKGYNICVTGTNGSWLTFSTIQAQSEMEDLPKGIFEECMYESLISKTPHDMSSLFRKYDYQNRTSTINAICSIIFLPIFAKVIDDILTIREKTKITNYMDDASQVLEDYTENRGISFGNIVNYINDITNNVISDDFFNLCIDYIANITLDNHELFLKINK